MNDMKSIEIYINSIPKFSPKTTPENLRAVLKLLGNPQDNFKAVHVAGTNGKGSVSGMVAKMLEDSGLKTGLFVSPHLLKVNERMSINGEMISDEDFAACFNEVMYAVRVNIDYGGVHPSYFEMLFLMAAVYFSKMSCKAAVFETGLGGRLDATNVLQPAITSITSIGMDHMQYLGNTIRDIAYEKAGIIKRGIPVISHVTGEAEEVIRNTAAEKSAEYIDVSKQTEASEIQCIEDGIHFTLRTPEDTYEDVVIHTYAAFQVDNAETAVSVYEKILGYRVFPEMAVDAEQRRNVVRKALGEFGIAGRFDFLTDNVILDGAHNEAASVKLCESIDYLRSVRSGIKGTALLFAVSEDKDYDSVIRVLTEGLKPSRVYISGLSTSRRLDPEIVRDVFVKYVSADTTIKCYDIVLGAYNEALRKLDDDEILICTGSLYLSQELKV